MTGLTEKFASVLLRFPDDKMHSKDKLKYWQYRALYSILMTSVILGFFACIPSIWLSLKEGLYTVAVFDITAYLFVLYLFFSINSTYTYKATSTCILCYLVGLVLLIVLGPFRAGPVWLFTFPIFTGVLLGFRASLKALAVNAITLASIGILMQTELIDWSIPLTNPVEKWLVIFINFFLLNTAATVSMTSILKGLKTALNHEKALRVSFQNQHVELEKTNRLLNREIIERQASEKKRAELETRIHQAQRLESVGTLAGGIAHDFNNILSSIIGYTELAIDATEDESELHKHLNGVFSASKRARELVQQILTFSRQDKPELIPVQPAHIAKETLKLLRSSIPSTVDIIFRENSGTYIMGDPTQMHQVIMNLCTNSAQAMLSHGGKLTVEISDVNLGRSTPNRFPSLPRGAYLIIKVTDQGTGVSKKIMNQIFEPYFTTKAPGTGTGLGLSVVHGIVKKFNGDIFVDSIEGAGTTFTILLPALKSFPETALPESTVLPGGKERILVVDDEPEIVDMATQTLKSLGYTVYGMTNSVNALDIFRQNPGGIDLVISDLTMPEITGDRLATQMLEIKPDLPVIICTGFNKSFSEEAVLKLGVRALAQKPLIKKELAIMVRTILDDTKQ